MFHSVNMQVRGQLAEHFCPSILGVPGMKLRSLGLVANTYLLIYLIGTAMFFNKTIVQFSKISFIDKIIVSQYEWRPL